MSVLGRMERTKFELALIVVEVADAVSLFSMLSSAIDAVVLCVERSARAILQKCLSTWHGETRDVRISLNF